MFFPFYMPPAGNIIRVKKRMAPYNIPCGRHIKRLANLRYLFDLSNKFDKSNKKSFG